MVRTDSRITDRHTDTQTDTHTHRQGLLRYDVNIFSHSDMTEYKNEKLVIKRLFG